MDATKYQGLDKIMEFLFTPYKEKVKDVDAITSAMLQRGIINHPDEIINDHIAFRTLGINHLGIDSLEKIFLHYGYKKRDYYHFDVKKLDAYWYSPPSPRYPRVFISQLRVADLSESSQAILYGYTRHIQQDPVDLLDLGRPEEVGNYFYKPLWKLPTLQDYRDLAVESEYAAWVLYNRYYLNHYTISLHNLPSPYQHIENFNEFLEEIGIVLNSSGGKIKVSRDGLLKQSSTVAQMVEADFAQGEKALIAGSYVEFAERLPLPLSNTSDEEKQLTLRDGFEATNADKIFESTYQDQTKKKK